MLWKEIKTWAKYRGYKADRTKITDKENSYNYIWSKIDEPTIAGSTTSVSKLAFAIYNDITNNAHLEYQEEYRIKLSETDVDHNTGFGFQ